MTDNEIVKALDWCEQFENNIVFKGSGDEKCIQALQMMMVMKHALRNYHSQKAEIERCQKVAEKVLLEVRKAKELYYKDISTAKAEAIKEFAERLKDECDVRDGFGWFEIEAEEFLCLIDNLVKEMVGDNNE